MASRQAVRRGKSLVSRAVVEAVEARTLLAITTNGPASVLGTGVNAVESASATPDVVNQYRYASLVTGANGAAVVPVSGEGGPGNVGTALAIGGSTTKFNTDVASNFPGNRVVAVYSEFTSRDVDGTPGPGGTPDYTITDTQVYAELFVNGNRVGNRILVNQQTDVATPGDPNLPVDRDPRVAMDGSGNFVVVWETDIPGQAVLARQFNADGSDVGDGDQFVVSTVGNEPDVARNATGAFVVGYNVASGNETGTFIQSYNAGGVLNGDRVRVTAEQFSEPAVGIANNGRIVVAWAQGDGAGRRVLAQRYSAAGDVLGTTFSVSSANNTPQTAPQLAVDISGGFAIGWSTAVGAETRGDIGFRVFSAAANPRAADTVISGVQFLTDHRFGLAYRLPGDIHVAFVVAAADPNTLTGDALMQSYVDDSVAGDEIDVPNGAYLVDLSSYPGVDLLISDEGNVFNVTINGTTTTHATAPTIYVRGSEQGDRLRMALSITVPVIIYGRGGRDTIVGGQGNDILDGGAGGFRNFVPVGNLINGSAGNDEIYGGGNLSTVFGGAGDDTVTAGFEGLIAFGEDGNDTLIGGEAIDALDGGAGNDSITGGSGGDNIDGRAGDDVLFGEDGFDYIFGSNGNDYINGGLDGDYCNGGRGQDRILGEGGRDTLLGGAEADYLRGGGGVRFSAGGNPTDRLDIYYYDTLDELSGSGTRLLVP